MRATCAATNQVEETTQILDDGPAVWFNTYTPSDQVETSLDPAAVVKSFEYDLRNRQTKSTVLVNGVAEVSEQGFDGNGNRTSVRPPKGNAWTYEYDEANRLQRVESPEGYETHYKYSLDDVLTEVTDANQHVSVRTQDALGRTKTYTYPATEQCSAPDCRTQTLLYDGEGQVRSLTQPNGATRSTELDALNRISTETASQPGQGSLVQTQIYDANNNARQLTLVGESSQSGVGTLHRVINRTFDARDRLTNEKIQFSQGVSLAPTLGDFSSELDFDVDPEGNRIRHRDATDALITSSFDAANRPQVAQAPDGTSTLSWNPDGTLKTLTHSNGTQTRYGYDEAKRIKLIEHLRGGAAFLNLSYEYDANGNREEERRIESGLPGQGSRAIVSSYGLDDDDRLTDVTVTHTPADPQVPDTRTVWTPDGVGNRRSETVTNLSNSQVLNQKIYDYNARDQLTEVADSVTGTTVRFGYDANGNRTSREVWRGAPLSLASRIEYRFDARDRLVRADPAPPNPINAPTVQFVYDAEDRKFARIETPWLNGAPVPANAKATVQLYDGDQLIHEAQPSTEPASNTPNAQGLKLTDTYRRSAMMDRHVAFGPQGTGGGTSNPESTIRFYQLDALGTPIGMSDEFGAAVVSTMLDAWGNPVQQTAEGQSSAPVHSGNQSQDPNQTGQAALLSNDQQAIGFTGYQKDEALGLYYANARFYDPLVGAFGATDPWAGDPSRPVTLNKFLYANGNPVVFVDPDGRRGRDSFGADLALYRSQMDRPEDIARVDSMIQRNTLEQAGRADAIQSFATETLASAWELGKDVHSAQISHQTFGLVDTGGHERLEDRSFAAYRFLANDPIDAIGSNWRVARRKLTSPQPLVTTGQLKKSGWALGLMLHPARRALFP
ncbi:MAG: RHS repeat protein [Ahniella sp.]|nr:RHS repeat protein [Ahniella sp.]